MKVVANPEKIKYINSKATTINIIVESFCPFS